MIPASVPDLAALLGRTVQELQAVALLPYRRFPKPKRDGSQRPMAEPAAALKEAQRALLTRVWSHFPVHDAAHGVIGRSALTNARVHLGATGLIKLDLREFFPSISAGRIVGFLEGHGAASDVARMLAALATVPDVNDERWLPVGAPTSNAIANAICWRLDRRLNGFATANGAFYTRYVDDLTFSFGGNVMPSLGWLIRRIIHAEGFAVNQNKTRELRTPTRVTGYVLDGEELRASRHVRRRLRAAEHNLRHGRGDSESTRSLRNACSIE